MELFISPKSPYNACIHYLPPLSVMISVALFRRIKLYLLLTPISFFVIVYTILPEIISLL